eukprot:TRINITY_DN56198_c0_g1_i1.p1 TRINITY_DN56198_c0_g1~~TRINITY_DN56198_c0_g1_i1.p1  ORF type:complete len:122 (+),score=24.59 TRINITY_DN56198_c0_g1_i1:60-425(+)
MSNDLGEDEIRLKLIFANDNFTHEFCVSLNTPVGDVKKTILEQGLPETFGDVETIERLRLFAGGKELGGKDAEDQKTLKDARIMVNATLPTPVHVNLRVRSTEQAAEKETTKPFLCTCILL